MQTINQFCPVIWKRFNRSWQMCAMYANNDSFYADLAEWEKYHKGLRESYVVGIGEVEYLFRDGTRIKVTSEQFKSL